MSIFYRNKGLKVYAVSFYQIGAGQSSKRERLRHNHDTFPMRDEDELNTGISKIWGQGRSGQFVYVVCEAVLKIALRKKKTELTNSKIK